MDQLRFSIPELLSLIGVTQCVYLLVYISFRAGRISRAGLPLLYFFVLGLAFLADFGASHIGTVLPHYDYIRWFAWFYGPPLSVLLVIQIAQITKVPDLRHYWVVLLPPTAFALSRFFAHGQGEIHEWLTISGLVAGAISLLAIWVQSRRLLDSIQGEKGGKERYWLVLTLIVTNVLFLATALSSLSPAVSAENAVLMRTVLGLGFIYLVTTSLFRIYPQAVSLSADPGRSALSGDEQALARKIEELMTREKVYQESAYSRADLARECGASEAVISKVINLYFRKSFPQMINERRIADAKELLRQTDAPVNIICSEVGFNSLPSFNRVFKDMTGVAPSEYRKAAQK